MEKKSKIYKFLRDGNTFSLSRFIYLCLYERALGYYHNKKIGSDFTTSPEVSQVFGECISIFLTSIFNQIGKINNFCELGPGNGTLAKDLISSLVNFQGEKLNYFLYEKSERLNIKSFNKLSKQVNFKILKKLEFPKKPIFFLGNEFFDALPINQFEKNNIWMERRVKLENKKFKIVLKKNPYCNINDKSSKKGKVSSPLKTEIAWPTRRG